MAQDKTERNNDIKEIRDGLLRVTSGHFSAAMRLSTDNPNTRAIAQALNNIICKLKDMINEMSEENRLIKTNAERLIRIFDNSKDIILYINKYGTIVDVNKTVREILGYNSYDLKGKHFAKTEHIATDRKLHKERKSACDCFVY
ncbi:MAG: PAS domain S-box protein [bacterium]